MNGIITMSYKIILYLFFKSLFERVKCGKLLIQLLVYLVSLQIGYIVAQDADIYSFNRVSIPLSIGNNFSLLSKTVLFTNYTSYDSPKLVFIQQSFQRDIIELDKFTLRIQFLYRKSNLPEIGSQSEYRPIQELIYSHDNSINLRQKLRIEQRFKDQYSNRIWYSFNLNVLSKSDRFLPKRISNDFLIDFNNVRKKVENRLTFRLIEDLNNKPIEIGIQHRLRNLYNNEKIKHLIVLRTNWSIG